MLWFIQIMVFCMVILPEMRIPYGINENEDNEKQVSRLLRIRPTYKFYLFINQSFRSKQSELSSFM